MAFRVDERDGEAQHTTTERRTTTVSASVEKRSARIMSFRRIIMRERSRRARQSVSFTYRGRFNYPIASSLPHHHSGPLFHAARFLFRAIESPSRNSRACARVRLRAGRRYSNSALSATDNPLPLPRRENDRPGPDNDEQELALKRNDRHDRAFIGFRVSRATFNTSRQIPDYRFAVYYRGTTQWSEEAAQWTFVKADDGATSSFTVTLSPRPSKRGRWERRRGDDKSATPCYVLALTATGPISCVCSHSSTLKWRVSLRLITLAPSIPPSVIH